MVDILALGSHPDDIEFLCGGILAKMAADGKKIVMANLTSGERGTNGTPEVRRQEAKNAAAVIGAEMVFLDFKDCEIYDNHEGRLKLVRLFREYKPRLVIAPDWQGVMNHPDHLATGLLARNACRFSRFAKILPELPIHRVEGILHNAHANIDVPDFLVDISDHVDTWKKMMECHRSQSATFDFIDWNLRVASKLGSLINVPFAQGLIKGNPIVIDDIMTISKGTREI
jgi:bacillithiol biosynthesis deacetylase BshB1